MKTSFLCLLAALFTLHSASAFETLSTPILLGGSPVHWKVGCLPLGALLELAGNTDTEDCLLTYRGIRNAVPKDQHHAVDQLIASLEKAIANARALKRSLNRSPTSRTKKQK